MIKCPYKSYNEHEYDNSCYIRYERFEINNETFSVDLIFVKVSN